MSNIMLMFLLLLFLAGDVEKNRGPMGTPNNIPFLIITYIQFNIKSIISFKLIDTLEVFLKLLPQPWPYGHTSLGNQQQIFNNFAFKYKKPS
jgi:hypothetical protein